MSVGTNTVPAVTSAEKSEATPSNRPNPVALEAAVTVTGARPSSEGTRDLFTEETRTILVFVDGAVIQLAAGVAVGQLLFLTNQKTKEEVVCQILQKRVFRPTVCYVEVQFTEDKPKFWGVSFSKDKAGPVESKVAEHVEEQEKTEEERTAAAPWSEQEIEQLKRQVDTLREQVQELEKRKGEEGAAHDSLAVTPAPTAGGSTAAGTEPAVPKQATSGESLLMPSAAPAEKKTPRWAVPMALPGRQKSAGEAAAERDASEELLPKPELDFSQVPTAVNPDHGQSQSSYIAKGIPPHKMRQIALVVALVAAVGFAAYAKVWTALPILKKAAASVAQQVKNAASKRGSAKANVPAAGGATKSLPTGASGSSTNTPTNAEQSAAAVGTAAGSTAEAAPAPTKDETNATSGSGDAAESVASAPVENEAEPKRPEPSIARKTVNTRERIEARNRTAQAASAPEQKEVETAAADGPVVGPKLVHAAAPVYPPDAMFNYVTGDVKAEVAVGADGKVSDVKVISGPKALREAAITALKRYEYSPGTQGGKPVATRTTATVKFWFNP